MSPFTTGVILAVTTGLCWAVLAVFLKYALLFSTTGTIVWIRMVFATIILVTYYLFYKPKSVLKVATKTPLTILLAGVLLSMNYFGYMTGLEKTTAANAQIMIQFGPLGLLFLGVIYFKEELTKKQWIGMSIAALGFIFFNWDQIGIVKNYVEGNIWILFAGITWSVFAAIQKREMQKGWTPQEVNMIVYSVSAICLFPMANLNDLNGLSIWQWLILLSLGFNTVIAYGAFAEAMHRIPASLVSLIVTVNPLITILIVTLLDIYGVDFIPPEPIHWLGYLGALLVVFGVGVAVFFRSRHKHI